MKSLFWRGVVCLLPVLAAGWITTVAILKYQRGEAGGFKLGVDLVGGTILVYEIDIRKQLQDERKYEPQRDTNLLAESLKRRIDPNDLYNIVIRPAGGEGRVEIILPTGGRYREEKAQEGWDNLLDEVGKKYARVDVGRGRVQELADRVHTLLSEKTWHDKVFHGRSAWNDLWTKAVQRWPQLEAPVELGDVLPDVTSLTSTVAQMAVPAERALVGVSSYVTQTLLRTRQSKFQKLEVGQFRPFIEFMQRELGAGYSEKDIEAWIKKEAWQHMLAEARKKWPDVQASAEAMNEIDPDSNEQLISFIQAKGSVVAQGALVTLEPLLTMEELLPGTPKSEEIAKFIEDNYGPSRQEIVKFIAEKNPRKGKDLNVEDVQRIKDLVAKVGNLEFRILANSSGNRDRPLDDEQGIEAALAQLNNTSQTEKDNWAQKGLPPPGPRKAGTQELEVFEITLPRNNKSLVTYSWVELGPNERAHWDLDNAKGKDLTRKGATWREVKAHRNEAMRIPDPGSSPERKRFVLQGALFYSRICQDRNLPEEERTSKAVEYFILTRNAEIDPNDPQKRKETPKIDGRYLISATADYTSGRPAVAFTFNSSGGELFGTLTRKNVPSGTGPEESQSKRHLAIILDGQVMNAPTVNSEIRTHGQITGSFSQKEVEKLVNILRSGALPASLKQTPVSENTMGSTLGQDTVEKGVIAVVVSFFVVMLFMSLYYRFAGLVASVALLANLILTVGFMIFVQATFTLPGLAGLVLMLGMAVDANVLIYERLREERDRGASLALALRNGYDRAFPTIIDTHLSSIFTAIVLYVVGNDQLKGFGISLTVGLIISLFTSLYMTRFLFDLWLNNGWLKKLTMMRFFQKPDIDFMGVRYLFFTITIVVSILGIGVFIARLPNVLDIDFKGGTAYTSQLTGPKTITELRELLSDDNQSKRLEVAKVKETDTREVEVFDEKGQKTGTTQEGGNRFDITYLEPDGKTSTRSVTLANRAPKPTPSERENVIKERAEQLPDVGMVLLYPSSQKAEGSASAFFTVRTSEKEVELVQAAVDRLLATLDVGIEVVEEDGGVKVKSVTRNGPADGALQAGDRIERVQDKEVRSGADFHRYLAQATASRQVQITVKRGEREEKIALNGELKPLLKKRFIAVDPLQPTGTRLRFYAKDPAEYQALTGKKFNPQEDASKQDLAAAEQEKNWTAAHAWPKSFDSPSFFRSLFVRELFKAFNIPEKTTRGGKSELPFQLEISGEGKTNQEGRNHILRIAVKPDLTSEQFARFKSALDVTEREFRNRPQPDQLENFDSQLAAETRLRAMWAILASWGAIALYLWFRFGSWTFGLAAVLCLIHDLFFTMGLMAACYYVHGTWFGDALLLQDFKLDLNAVAALLTLVGYSVNDTIVVFDRIREVRGKNPDLTPQMINDSVNQTLSRTLLTSFATFLVCIVLYIWGGPGVHLFAFLIILGIFVGTYSSIYIASPLLLIFGEGARSEMLVRGPRTEAIKEGTPA